ncbi:uncharacterized protein LOC127167588 [Labeo rohita]|uniref:uncharacterized protein LOC127167588 n=1 Tax=Labeo rohita TaxID=84645 RepID=UPI0021E311C0|nr:uncharacterized protein LOC127167588 [Labeo rohita]
MAEHISEILAMGGVKKRNVEIKPTCSPSPCVHLTGPRCEVEDLKDSLKAFIQSLKTKECEVKGPGAQQFFQGEGAETLKIGRFSSVVLIIPINQEPKVPERGQIPQYTSCFNLQSLQFTASSQYSLDSLDSVYSVDNEINIKVVVGSLVQQQADVFVAPMIQTNMTSTLIGSSLLNKAGQQLQNNFYNAKGLHTLKPGEVLVVEATPALGCSKVFFIECAPKGNKHISEKALHSGLRRVFQLCEQNSFGSVALPVIGPGIVLSIPVKDAVNILTHEICKFLSGPTGQLHTICIPIMPNYPNSEEMFQTVRGNLSAEMVDSTGQALFQSLTSDLDEIIMIVDRTEVHLVFGDITNETTDAIVNTTDFKDFQTAGVCKDILTKAGPQIQAQLTGAQVASGQIFTTLSGGFPCKTIMHVCGQRDPAVIKTLAKEIVVQCERGRCRSVAIPAICAGEGFAGQGGLDPSVVAKSILEGVKEAPAPLVPTSATRRGRSATTSGHWASTRMSRSHSLPGALNLSALATSLPDTESRAVFLVIGYSDAEVSDACRELKRAYDNQCTTQTFTPDEMNCLTSDEMDQLLFKVDLLHLQVETKSSEQWVVKGLKDGVNEVLKLTKDAALRQVRKKVD